MIKDVLCLEYGKEDYQLPRYVHGQFFQLR